MAVSTSSSSTKLNSTFVNEIESLECIDDTCDTELATMNCVRQRWQVTHSIIQYFTCCVWSSINIPRINIFIFLKYVRVIQLSSLECINTVMTPTPLDEWIMDRVLWHAVLRIYAARSMWAEVLLHRLIHIHALHYGYIINLIL